MLSLEERHLLGLELGCDRFPVWLNVDYSGAQRQQAGCDEQGAVAVLVIALAAHHDNHVGLGEVQ